MTVYYCSLHFTSAQVISISNSHAWTGLWHFHTARCIDRPDRRNVTGEQRRSTGFFHHINNTLVERRRVVSALHSRQESASAFESAPLRIQLHEKTPLVCDRYCTLRSAVYGVRCRSRAPSRCSEARRRCDAVVRKYCAQLRQGTANTRDAAPRAPVCYVLSRSP
jgi:hypothetical protein